MRLPRQDKEGRYYISYSQYSSFKADKGFNTGLPGKLEYIQEKFFGWTWEDKGFGRFGKDVEDYICYKDIGFEQLNIERAKEGLPNIEDIFLPEEMTIMDQIEPLGNYQVEVKWELADGVYLLGYIDDSDNKNTHIRDYKTASENSSKKYYTPEYEQLDIYSGYIYQEKGYIPKRLEVVMIERLGNAFRNPGRENLVVGSRVWYHDRETSLERIESIKQDIIEVAREISFIWEVWLVMKKWK